MFRRLRFKVKKRSFDLFLTLNMGGNIGIYVSHYEILRVSQNEIGGFVSF